MHVPQPITTRMVGLGIAVFVPTLLAPTTLVPGVRAADDPPAARAVYAQPFHGKPDDMQRYALRGTDAGNYIIFEPEGLRLRLPTGHPGQRPSTGVALLTSIRGDFDLSARFELLKEPEPEDAGPSVTRVTLSVLLDTPERNEAALSRRMMARGVTQFFTFLVMEPGGDGKAEPRLHTVPTTAKAGRLRLVRTGSMLSFFASAGADGEYEFLKEYPFSTQDVKQVFLNGSTGGPKADLDVRLNDLRIVAASLPDLGVSSDPPTGSRRWLTAAVLLNGLLLLAAVAGWLARRRRREKTNRKPTVPSRTEDMPRPRPDTSPRGHRPGNPSQGKA